MVAITWQNINGPSLAEAIRPLEGAQQSFNSMFDAFGNILKKREATDAANWDQGKINNKEAFLNTLYAAKSPEEMAALQKSGKLNTMLTDFGAQVADPSALRAAMEGRLSTLQQQAKTGVEFNNFMADEKFHPVKEQYKVAALNGDKATMQRIQTEYANQRGIGDLVAAGVDTTHKNQEWAWKEGAQKQVEKMRPYEEKKVLSDLATAGAQRISALATAGAANQQVNESKSRIAINTAQEDTRLASNLAALKQASSQAELKGTIYEGGVYTGKNAMEISTLIDSTTGNRLDEADKRAMKTWIAKIDAEGGIKTDQGTFPIPLDFLKSAILGAKDEGWGWSTGGVNYLERTFKEAMGHVQLGKDAAGNDKLISPAVDGLAALERARRKAVEFPVATNPKGGGDPKQSGEYKPPKTKK